MNPQIKLPYQYPKAFRCVHTSQPLRGTKAKSRKHSSLYLKRKTCALCRWWCGDFRCTRAYLELADKAEPSCGEYLDGLGCIPWHAQNSLGMLGMHGTYEANMAMHEADLIFGIGVRFDDRTTNNLENTVRMRKLCTLISTHRRFQKRESRFTNRWFGRKSAYDHVRFVG
ncbi:hypothetical protein [Vibrio sp.]|uniref:hypothetical protein n=1 Tax=Vibrio sp. TaxID=678 RepID=UPI003AA877EE